MTSSTNFKVTRSLTYTATKPKSDGKPNHVNEDAFALQISDGFLKYAAIFDGAGGSGNGLTKSGKTQAFVTANFLANNANKFLDFSSTNPRKMKASIKDRQDILKNLFEELVADQALPDQSTGIKVSGDPVNRRFPTTLAAVVSDSEGGLYTIFRGDSQIFGIFEKKIIPLSLISNDKLTPSQNNLCFIDIGELQSENAKNLGALRGVIICSDGFLENNTAFGYPYDDVIYTNLQTIYNITLNENTDFSKGQLKKFLDSFVGDDDKTMVSLIFSPPEVLKDPFYMNHRAVNFKNQMQISDELSMKQRLLVLSTATPGPKNFLGRIEAKGENDFEDRAQHKAWLEVVFSGVRMFREKVSLEYFYVQNPDFPEISSEACVTLETLMMILASQENGDKNWGLAAMLEAISSAKTFFDTTHLVGTPLGLLSANTQFQVKDYADLRKLKDPMAKDIEIRFNMTEKGRFLAYAQKIFLGMPKEKRNDFGCTYLEPDDGQLAPHDSKQTFTLDTSSFDYVCLVINPRELKIFSPILKNIPYPEIKKFRIFTVEEENIREDLVALQGLDKNTMGIALEAGSEKHSPGEKFLDFIKKLVEGNKTSIKIQSLEEHKRIFRGDTPTPQGGDDGQGTLF
jgi:hypothetical protein